MIPSRFAVEVPLFTGPGGTNQGESFPISHDTACRF
jgi:hypothetical protein